MTKFHFYLRNKSKDETKGIYLYASNNNSRFTIYTKSRIIPNNWDSAKEEATRKEKEYYSINKNLCRFKKYGIDFFDRCFENGIFSPTKSDWEDYWDSILNPSKKDIDFFDKYSEFIIMLDFRQNMKGQTITERRKQNYIRNLELLKEFQHNRKRITFLNFDNNTFDDFTNFLTYKKKFSKNYIRQHIKLLKSFFNYEENRGIQVNTYYKRHNVKEELSKHLALTEEEITKIYNHDFSHNEKLDNVRDLFIIGCFTGLRYSDLFKLKINDFQQNIQIIAQKTKKNTLIPISEPIDKILEKRNGNLPKRINAANFNIYIKKVLYDCGIDRPIKETITKGGNFIINEKKAFEAVSSATARRTFATLLYEKGIPLLQICDFTGHSDTKTLLRYINPDPTKSAGKIKGVLDAILK